MTSATDAATTEMRGKLSGAVSLRKLTKEYLGPRAVDAIDLEIPAGEFFTLLGPSGCGKTSTLMMLAGLVEPTSGSVIIDGNDVAHVSATDRNVGVVFQNYALFPHMTVFQNLAFPLEMRKLRPPEIKRRVGEVLELVQLVRWVNSYPSQLSGGQQQRVAVARAIVFNPRVLLMDEPLGALDRTLRQGLQLELRSLQRQLGLTVVYVTHDQDEAMSMSDRIAIMRNGRIEQVGTPTELYDTPSSVFVANFVGDNNNIACQVVDNSHVRAGETILPVAPHKVAAESSCVALIRPEKVKLSATAGTLTGVVRDVVYLGSVSRYELEVAGVGVLRAAISHTGEHAVWNVGQRVGVELPAPSLRVMSQDSAS